MSIGTTRATRVVVLQQLPHVRKKNRLKEHILYEGVDYVIVVGD